MNGSTRAFLSDFQARFGAAVCTPLGRRTGTLRALPASYDRALLADIAGDPARAGARLAVYNRQYWFRLFGVLQDAFALTARLLGYWSFNELAARFLREVPPRGFDIDRVPDGFEQFLAGAVSVDRVIEPALLLEAARVDASWRDVFAAPHVTPYRPEPADVKLLLASRLVPSPAVVVLELHWPLLELKQGLASDPGERRLPQPARSTRAEWWALGRTPTGVGQRFLTPREGELHALLRRHSVGEALERLEAECSPAERATLPERAREWLARSVEYGFWIGLERNS
ncbi:MAG TPA: DNA-binding domain-containing protein [Polyangiaceae bacterium]|jgi:hypothetical protein|nr:DNA-binding domain-containing protein [Polyangiaceae bacterium]